MKQSTIDTIRELLNNANGRPCNYPKMDAIEDADRDFEDCLENDDFFIEDLELEEEDNESLFCSTTYFRSLSKEESLKLADKHDNNPDQINY